MIRRPSADGAGLRPVDIKNMLLALLPALGLASAAPQAEPLKVFVLAGQYVPQPAPTSP